MATCFCGCGRKIGRFPLFMRSANNVGQSVSERLGWAKAVIGDRLDLGWVAEGDDHVLKISEALHGNMHPRDIQESAISHWLAYGREIEALAVRANAAPPIILWLGKPRALEATMGRWVRESGLSTEEAAAELTRRMDAGEPLPWASNEIPLMPDYSRVP
jgi:hypothetical protein